MTQRTRGMVLGKFLPPHLGHEHLDTLQHSTKRTIADLKQTHAKCHPRERES